jgi:hypothetical protein
MIDSLTEISLTIFVEGEYKPRFVEDNTNPDGKKRIRVFDTFDDDYETKPAEQVRVLSSSFVQGCLKFKPRNMGYKTWNSLSDASKLNIHIKELVCDTLNKKYVRQGTDYVWNFV